MFSNAPRVHRRGSVRAHADRFIYGKRDSVLGDFERQLKRKGSYAVTSLIVRLNDPNYTEKDVDLFVESFSKVHPLYMNLKQVHIDAPYSAIRGETIANIMNIDSCFNELRLDTWTFHSPCDDQWQGAQLDSLRVTLSDGVAFPYAFPLLLSGLSKHQASLKNLCLINESPHNLTVNKRLLPPRAFADIRGIEVVEDRMLNIIMGLVQ